MPQVLPSQAAMDAETPAEDDAQAGEGSETLCEAGEAFCSDDATSLNRCIDGAWETTACLALVDLSGCFVLSRWQ